MEVHLQHLANVIQWELRGDAIKMGRGEERDHIRIIYEFKVLAFDSLNRDKKELVFHAQNSVCNPALGARVTGFHPKICSQDPPSALLGNQLRQNLCPLPNT